jgi:hypothetical protein
MMPGKLQGSMVRGFQVLTRKYQAYIHTIIKQVEQCEILNYKIKYASANVSFVDGKQHALK